MPDSAIVLWLIAAGLALAVARRGYPALHEATRSAALRLVTFLPRIALALMTAGFVSKLVPGEPVAHAMGPESGFWGILIASAVGGFIPSGPMISFPLVVVLKQVGAGTPQLVAFLTAWAVFALHRVFVYELALMGWRFSAVRLTASLALPPLAGVLALAMCAVLGID